MNPDWLLKQVADGVGTLTVNRPEVRNAITSELVFRLGDDLLELDADPQVRCIVLRGAGGYFISGADVSGFAGLLEQGGDERKQAFRVRLSKSVPYFERLSHLTKPLVTVAEGATAGAGLVFVLASDYVLASNRARFIFAQPRIGLPLDCGVSYYLPRVIGLGRARSLAITGGMLEAQEALQLGMVAELAEDDELRAALAKITQHITALPEHALKSIKRQLGASLDNDISSQLALEVELAADCAGQDEFARRVRKFLNR